MNTQQASNSRSTGKTATKQASTTTNIRTVNIFNINNFNIIKQEKLKFDNQQQMPYSSDNREIEHDGNNFFIFTKNEAKSGQ